MFLIYNIYMPTIMKIHNFRFFFYSNESNRKHIHVKNGEFEVIVWLDNFEIKKSNAS